VIDRGRRRVSPYTTEYGHPAPRFSPAGFDNSNTEGGTLVETRASTSVRVNAPVWRADPDIEIEGIGLRALYGLLYYIIPRGGGYKADIGLIIRGLAVAWENYNGVIARGGRT
jgi:hypothetical protein